MEAGNRSQAHEFHAVEAQRAALLAGDESDLEDIVALAPEDERALVRSKIRQLVRNAKAEAEKNKPPRTSRALFRLLRELRHSGSAAGSMAEGNEEDQADDALDNDSTAEDAQDLSAEPRKVTF